MNLNAIFDRVGRRSIGLTILVLLAVSSISTAVISQDTTDSSSSVDIGPDSCPENYVWVPGSTKYGTQPGFCMMAYEAKKSSEKTCEGASCPVSKPEGAPYASVTQMEAKNLCSQTKIQSGGETHLITEAEWMTMATNIASTPINDVSPEPGIQLATGHSDIEDNSPRPSRAVNATSGDEPVVSGCNLNKPMWHEDNKYVEGSCEIRGNGVNSKGYAGTNDSFSQNYEPGEPGRSQMRTFVLSNGEVVWDVSGNVLEWTDRLSMPEDQPVNATGGGGPLEYSEVASFNSYDYTKPPYYSKFNGTAELMNSKNGTGIISTVPKKEGLRSSLRGGSWSSGKGAGVFFLALFDVPNNYGPPCGFRCAASPK